MSRFPKRALDRLRAVADDRDTRGIEIRHVTLTFHDAPDPPASAAPPPADTAPAPPQPLRTAPDRARCPPPQAPRKPVSLMPGDALPSLADPAYDAPGGLALAIHAVAHKLGVHPVNVSMSDIERFYEGRRSVVAAAVAARAREQARGAVERETLADAGWAPLASK